MIVTCVGLEPAVVCILLYSPYMLCAFKDDWSYPFRLVSSYFTCSVWVVGIEVVVDDFMKVLYLGMDIVVIKN